MNDFWDHLLTVYKGGEPAVKPRPVTRFETPDGAVFVPETARKASTLDDVDGLRSTASVGVVLDTAAFSHAARQPAQAALPHNRPSTAASTSDDIRQPDHGVQPSIVSVPLIDSQAEKPSLRQGKRLGEQAPIVPQAPLPPGVTSVHEALPPNVSPQLHAGREEHSTTARGTILVPRIEPHLPSAPPQPVASPRQPLTAPVIEVTIGRIEVHAPAVAAPAPARPIMPRRPSQPRQPVRNLDVYLQRRNGGSS